MAGPSNIDEQRGDDAAFRLAVELERRGLAAPVRLLADAHRPLGPLLSDVGAWLSPFIGALGGRPGRELAELLADERGIDRLVAGLDEATGRNAGPR